MVWSAARAQRPRPARACASSQETPIWRARSCHQRALDLAHETGIAWNEANALAGLGRCALAADHTTQAITFLRQALEIFQRIGTAEANDVSRELTALTEAGPPA